MQASLCHPYGINLPEPGHNGRVNKKSRRMTYLYRETIVNFEPKSKCLEEEEEYFISNSGRFRHVT
jgi:hypothetical protein